MPCLASAGFSGWAPSATRSNTSERQRRLRLKELPHLVFGARPEKTIRYFPDKLPIGITGDGRTHVFLYLVNRKAPVDFRAFLHRHVGAAASSRPSGSSACSCRATCWRRRRSSSRLRERSWAGRFGSTTWTSFAGISGSKTRSITVARPRTSGGFAAPVALSGRRGFTCSIGSGRRTAIGPLDATVSPVLEDKIARRRGHVTSEVAGSSLCPSLTPGWLGMSLEIGRTEGGTTGSGGAVPLLGACGEAGERREAMRRMREGDCSASCCGRGSC